MIAAELGYSYIDSGAMYRAVTLACMEAGLFDHSNEPSPEQVESLLDSISLDLRFNREKERTEIFLNGTMVEDRIRDMEVSGHVSYIAAIPAVRRKLVEYQRKLGKGRGVVMDGRDIGTVVFPDAGLKIFLTASPEIRAERRYLELLGKGIPATREEVMENLAMRDHIDSTRADSPLRQAEDALVIDNSHMTLDQQMDWFRDIFRKILEGYHGEG
jgi:CMP/dCMP kinase